MGMSLAYGPPKERQEVIPLLLAAVEEGTTFFDTAEVYGPYTHDELGSFCFRAPDSVHTDR